MPDYTIIEINDATIERLQPLADEAMSDGDKFIQKTIDEWKSGKNTFSKENENFWGIVIGGELVGVGGLNQDPYVEDENIGRVRHVYILKKYRGQGLSKVLMKLIMDTAKHHFKTLRLSTYNPVAASLYESLGFEKVNEYKASHIIRNLRTLNNIERFMMLSNIFLILPVVFAALYNEWLYCFFASGIFIFSPLFHWHRITSPVSVRFQIFKAADWLFAVGAFLYMYYFIYQYVGTSAQSILYTLLTLVVIFFWYGWRRGEYNIWHPWFHIVAPLVSTLILIVAN